MADEHDRAATFVELLSPGDRLRFVCEWTERYYLEGRTVCILLNDEAEADELDSLLWTFRQEAFIPHVRLEKAEEPVIEPVIIATGDPDEVESDALILGSGDGLPEGFERFGRICDFAVVYDEGLRQASRDRFAACKNAGYHMRFVKG